MAEPSLICEPCIPKYGNLLHWKKTDQWTALCGYQPSGRGGWWKPNARDLERKTRRCRDCNLRREYLGKQK